MLSTDPHYVGRNTVALGWGGDGYDRMGVAERLGWRCVAAWGEDGWDLGDWPYVMVYVRQAELTVPDGEGGQRLTLAGAEHVLGEGRRYEVMTDVEGDIDVWSYPTDLKRVAGIDHTALFYWVHGSSSSGPETVRVMGLGMDDVDKLPVACRGPYSRKWRERWLAERGGNQ